MSRSRGRVPAPRHRPRAPRPGPSTRDDRAVPLLAATMIVKNEAANLPRLLASLTGLVDEVCVYDTGSTDNTVAIARAAGARVVQGYWDDDFGRARNAALAMTRAEWALIVDGDDEVTGDPGPLRAYLSGAVRPAGPPIESIDLVVVQVVNAGPDGAATGSRLPSPRIGRRAQVRWDGRVHEMLRSHRSGGTVQLDPSVVQIVHHGYLTPGSVVDKVTRNLALAQADLDDLLADPAASPAEVARTLLDLARSHLLLPGQREAAVAAFEAVRQVHPGSRYAAEATAILAATLLDDAREPQRVLDLVADLRTLPDGAPGQCDWLEAQARWQVGERDRAIELLAGVRELVDPMGLRQTMDRVLLARLLYCGAEQRVAEALTAGVELLCGHPPQAWYVSAVLQVAQGRPDELAHALAAGSGPHLDASLALLAAEPGGAEVADRVRRLRAAALVAAP